MYSCSVDMYGGNATISVSIGDEPQQKVPLLVCLDTLHIAPYLGLSLDLVLLLSSQETNLN